jgi:hypothetical protein
MQAGFCFPSSPSSPLFYGNGSRRVSLWFTDGDELLQLEPFPSFCFIIKMGEYEILYHAHIALPMIHSTCRFEFMLGLFQFLLVVRVWRIIGMEFRERTTVG